MRDDKAWTAMWACIVASNVWQASTFQYGSILAFMWLALAVGIYVTEKIVAATSTRRDK